MPDARGDVLCPTCGQWTPPAPFCTECGAALQGEVRDAVGGQGSDVFRRGREVDQPGTPWSAPGERFEPEPEDEAARAAAAARSSTAPPVDHFTEPEPEPERAPEPPAPAPPWPADPGLAGGKARPDRPAADERRSMDTPGATAAAGAGGAAVGAAAAGAAASGAAPAGPAAETTPATTAGAGGGRDRSVTATPPPVERPAVAPPPPPVAPPPASPPPPPRTYAAAQSDGGVSGLVFVVILGVMILALLGGAIVGGLFDGEPTAEGSPSPTASATESQEPTPEASSAAPTPGPSVAPTATPSSSTPSTFPDGFVARVEICDAEPSSPTCDNSGSVNEGQPWILVSFRHAKPTDIIGITVADDAGAVQDESSLSLSFCESNTDCPGYTYDRFGPLDPGSYNVRVTRNGTLASTTSFTVEE